MTVVFTIDYKGLAEHLHTEEADLRRVLHTEMEFLLKHIKSNGKFFTHMKAVESDGLAEGENFEIFMREFKREVKADIANQFQQIKKMLAPDEQSIVAGGDLPTVTH